MPELPIGWTWTTVDELLRERLRNGNSSRSSADGTGVPTFSLTAVTDNDFTSKNIKFTIADPAKVLDLWAEPGDIYVQRSNTPELVGTTRLFKGERNAAIFPDLLIRVRVSPLVSAEFVEIVLRGPYAHNYFRSHAQGISGSMPKIDQDVVRRTPIPLPPLDEQLRIVDAVAEQESTVGHLSKDIERELALAQRLSRSILEAAFRGKLVEPCKAAVAAEELMESCRKELMNHQGTIRRQQAVDQYPD